MAKQLRKQNSILEEVLRHGAEKVLRFKMNRWVYEKFTVKKQNYVKTCPCSRPLTQMHVVECEKLNHLWQHAAREEGFASKAGFLRLISKDTPILLASKQLIACDKTLSRMYKSLQAIVGKRQVPNYIPREYQKAEEKKEESKKSSQKQQRLTSFFNIKAKK